MRDLAIIVSAIVLIIIAIGVLSVVTVFRTPQSAVGRALALLINTSGIVAGTWFALLDVGIGARVMGVVVGLVSAISAFRVLRDVKS